MITGYEFIANNWDYAESIDYRLLCLSEAKRIIKIVP